MSITAEEVRAQLSQLNNKKVQPIPEAVKRMAEASSFHIYNVGPYTWIQRMGSMGTWTIQPAKWEGNTFIEISPALVVPGLVFETVTVDIDRQEQRPWDGREFVNDIIGVGKFKSTQQDLTRWGVFVTNGKEPSKKEIETAQSKLMERWAELVTEADGFQAQGPNALQNITAEHRRAAAAMNVERDWSKQPKPMIDCPGCGEKIMPGIAVHGGRYGCGAILDRKKAEALGLADKEAK